MPQVKQVRTGTSYLVELMIRNCESIRMRESQWWYRKAKAKIFPGLNRKKTPKLIQKILTRKCSSKQKEKKKAPGFLFVQIVIRSEDPRKNEKERKERKKRREGGNEQRKNCMVFWGVQTDETSKYDLLEQWKWMLSEVKRRAYKMKQYDRKKTKHKDKTISKDQV